MLIRRLLIGRSMAFFVAFRQTFRHSMFFSVFGLALDGAFAAFELAQGDPQGAAGSTGASGLSPSAQGSPSSTTVSFTGSEGLAPVPSRRAAI